MWVCIHSIIHYTPSNPHIRCVAANSLWVCMLLAKSYMHSYNASCKRGMPNSMQEAHQHVYTVYDWVYSPLKAIYDQTAYDCSNGAAKSSVATRRARHLGTCPTCP